jgi:hypothetical protein
VTFLLFTDLQITDTLLLNHNYHTSMSNICAMTYISFLQNTYNPSTKSYISKKQSNTKRVNQHNNKLYNDIYLLTKIS